MNNTSYDLLTHLRSLPNTSGIYQYFDSHGNLLYVGKAKNLKNRIKSYFCVQDNIITPKANLSPRIALMVSQIAQIHILLTQNEQDALILENSLIKSLKPKYNILLRDDKTYPYIYIDKTQLFPRFEITRIALKHNQIQYFGPFTNGARDLLESLYEILPLVQKKSCIKSKKSCMFHQIGKCPAPCEKKISPQDYAKTIEEGINFIENKKNLLKILEQKMQFYSDHLHFEEAAKIRDKMSKIASMQNESVIDMIVGNFDVFVIEKGQEHSVLMKLFIRDGRVVSSDFSLLHQDIESHNLSQAYTQAILSHYKAQMPLLPDMILIPYFTLESKSQLEAILQTNLQSKIKICQPQKGKKKDLVTLCAQNAQEVLRLQNKENDENYSILHSLQELLSLQHIPYHIEVFDTSHHSGEHSVGGMITYENNTFVSSKYRRYQLQGDNEYAQMREMLTRRVQSFETLPPPDLWLIDGGQAQIQLALTILQSMGANVEVIGISKMKINGVANRAKGNVQDIIRNKNQTFKLKPNDKRLQFFQKLRDEVHRYAITYHRYKKQKNIQKLQTMGKSYSPSQTKRLLNYFGSYECIKKASDEQIAQILRSKKLREKQ